MLYVVGHGFEWIWLRLTRSLAFRCPSCDSDVIQAKVQPGALRSCQTQLSLEQDREHDEGVADDNGLSDRIVKSRHFTCAA